ncbi:MAG: restriction endonuclease [Nanoarchaeota archaeon]|nr:restriction endonuclease [Nanoarchaeota archaeon]
MKIIKANGEVVSFNRKKIENSVYRSGASRSIAKKISKDVESSVKTGMKTSQIQKITLKSLGSCPIVRYKYNLKDAIMSLGPSGYTFEKYIAKILDNYGYKTEVGKKLRGKVVIQEIDIIATKNNFTSMIEAKYHNSHGIRTNTKVAMYTYARFLDVKSNPKNSFNDTWLVTNTACTNNAVRYSEGVKLKVISWNYPKSKNLRDMIEGKKLYPITIFKSISKSNLDKLFRANIVLAKDLSNSEINSLLRTTRINPKELKKIINMAKEVCT